MTIQQRGDIYVIQSGNVKRNVPNDPRNADYQRVQQHIADGGEVEVVEVEAEDTQAAEDDRALALEMRKLAAAKLTIEQRQRLRERGRL